MGAWGTLCTKSSALWHGQSWKNTSKAFQERKSQAAWADTCLALHMCACPKTCSQWDGTRVLCSRLWCCNLLLVPIPELQQFTPSSVLPVPPSPPAEAGASNWWWQHHIASHSPKTTQSRNHHNGTKHPFPEPSASNTSRKVIIQAQWYNSIFILVRRCFTARGPACILEIIHVRHVWAVPSPCEITSQGWTLLATIPQRDCFKLYNKELCCSPK